jgi:hypothetical protein
VGVGVGVTNSTGIQRSYTGLFTNTSAPGNTPASVASNNFGATNGFSGGTSILPVTNGIMPGATNR